MKNSNKPHIPSRYVYIAIAIICFEALHKQILEFNQPKPNCKVLKEMVTKTY